MAGQRTRGRRGAKTGPQLYPYQRRWVKDESRFKIACKARQIGFTFAAAWRAVDRRLELPGTTLWLSASERQALEAMEHVRRFAKELGVVALYEEDFLEGTLLKQHAVRFPNGSRIVALPANPDTVRGFAGDVVLDEFAFHRDADSIWRAAFATATRGFQLEIISTPNGARGRYYDLAKAAGLVDYEPPEKSRSLAALGMTDSEGARRSSGHGFSERSGDPAPLAGSRAETGEARRATLEGAWGNPTRVSPVHGARCTEHEARFLWSPHWVDLATARTQGFVVDVESLRAAIADEDAWQQEYCCRFLADAAHFLPPELVVAAEHPFATLRVALGEPRAATTTFFREGTALAVPNKMLAEGQPGKGSALRQSSGHPERKSRGGENLPRPALRAKPEGFPQRASGALYLGVDIGRRRDLTVLWLLEVEAGPAPVHGEPVQGETVYWTRGVLALDRQPFAAQRQALDALLALREVRRCAIDATGIGAMLAEELRAKWGARVEPVTFTRAVKESLAMRVKRLLEDGRLRIPADATIRAALGSVKRYVTPAGHIRFDAERTEAAGHADHFWALALALAAAEEPEISFEFVSSSLLRPWAQAGIY